MRTKRRSAAALLCCLWFLILASTTGVDLSTGDNASRIQETQDRREISSKSDWRIDEDLGLRTMKEDVENGPSSIDGSHDFGDDDEAVNTQPCNMKVELLRKMNSGVGSEWLIDNNALEILDNDPQQLIQCTSPGDKVVFHLASVRKFKRPLVVFHELELIARSPRANEVEDEWGNNASFTCPDNGPFLTVTETSVKKSGFTVENCTSFAGQGVVVVKSKATATFDNIKISNNKNRATYVESGASLRVTNSYFEDNEVKDHNGSAIWIASNVSLTISSSSFLRNYALGGGSLWAHDNNTIVIDDSTFYGNRATKRHEGRGGAIWVSGNINNIIISNSTLSENYAPYGGVISIEGKNNSFTMLNATLSGNSARYGGFMYNRPHNTFAFLNTMFLRNKANEYGGVIGSSGFGMFSIVNTTFSNNTALQGGAMWMLRNDNVTMVNSTFLGNKAGEYGGAIMLSRSNIASIVNSKLEGNLAKLHGGVVFLGSDCAINVTNSILRGNEARWGGGMHLELRSRLNISISDVSSNNATRGGVIFAGWNCDVTIKGSTVKNNRAEYGGCLYGARSSSRVEGSEFVENLSSLHGGCFYFDSTNAYFENNTLFHNKAIEKGGAIHGTHGSSLRMKENRINSNQAMNGGGIALVFTSRILCRKCTFMNNTALEGGGLYIEAQTLQIVIAQIDYSTFQNNTALRYGGGIVLKTFGSKSLNCTNIAEPCSRLMLVTTSFVDNNADSFGAAVLATQLNSILVACDGYYDAPVALNLFKLEDIRYEQGFNTLKKVENTTKQCESWKDNWIGGVVTEEVVGTFGQELEVAIDYSYGTYTYNDNALGIVLHNVTSGKALPRIILSVKDAFGNPSAPLYEEKAIMLSSERFLERPIAFSFENDTCVIDGIVSFVIPGTYTIKFSPKNDDLLEAVEMTIIVRKCINDEEPTLDGKVCQPCGEAKYNFNSSKADGCAACPKGANCTKHYIFPDKRYWNKSPCHDKMKKCIVENACDYANRTNILTNFVQDIANCDISKTKLEEYEEKQCHKGYKGPLCGSCKKSYGLSANFECSECAHDVVIVLRFIGAVLYLLIGTIITIKGVLPTSSNQQDPQDVETPLLEHGNITSMGVEGTSQVREEIEHESTDLGQSTMERDGNSSNTSISQTNDIEVTKIKLVSSLKITLNYFQVTSTAAHMDVEWTRKILDMLKGLNVLGAASSAAMSHSFDCIFTFASNASKAIWRVLFSLFIPLIVISILSFHWGYRSITKHGRDGSYFLRRLLLTVVTVTYTSYFDLTRAAMRTFSCVAVHANSDAFSNAITRYWIGDTALECYENTHLALVCISLVIAVLVTICFPLFCSVTLNEHRGEFRNTSSWTYETFGFLGGPFKQRFIYWECVTTMKKATLSIIMVFSYSLEVQAQGLLILLVLVFCLYIHFISYPYDEDYHSLNYYESGSLLVSCVTYTLVQFFSVEQCSKVARNIVSLSTIAINVGFVCAMAYKIVRDLSQLLRALLKSQSTYIPKNLNVISLIRVYYKRQSSRQDTT